MQSRRGVELLGLVLRRADPSFITLGLWGALQQLEGAIGDYPDPELRRSVYLHLFLEVRTGCQDVWRLVCLPASRRHCG